MKLFPIHKPLAGEKLAQIVPAPRRFVDDEDRRARLSFFPGRHLTDTALQREHLAWTQRLLLRGQAVASGVVEGLEVSLADAPGGRFFTLGAGIGLAASGEDMVLDRKLVVPSDNLPVFDPVARQTTGRLGDQPSVAGPRAGVLVWQPVSVPDTDIPAAGIPAGFDENFSPADRVPADEAYYRQTALDAVRLVLCFWPEKWAAMPAFDQQWRNRLAWEIFRAERRGMPPPWMDAGIPVALVGFDARNRPLFADSPAVARRGGRPRVRVLRDHVGEPRLWQAQVNQFAAHLAELATPATALANFRYLPPVGLLPKPFVSFDQVASLDENAKETKQWKFRQSFFPPTCLVQVAVVPLEQLDAVFDASRDLAPYDLLAPDSVRLLLPVSQRFFDPRLLAIEAVSDEFTDTIKKLVDARGVLVARRKDLRVKDSAIQLALTGKPATFPDPDPDRLDPDETADAIPENAPEDAYGTTAGDSTTVNALEEIRTAEASYLKRFTTDEQTELDNLKLSDYRQKQEAIQTDESAALDRLGLDGFIDYLEHKVTLADNLVDRGFLRINVGIYRLGQLLNNNALGTQVAASPSLGGRVVRNAVTSSPANVNLFGSRLFADLSSAANVTDDDDTPPATTIPGPAAGVAAAVAPVNPVFTRQRSFILQRPTVGTSGVSPMVLHTFLNAHRQLNTDDGKSKLASLDSLVAGNANAKATLETLKAASAVTPETATQISNLAHFAAAYTPNFNQITPTQIRAIPLDRLTPPAAPDARADLAKAKLEVFDKLGQLDLSLADLTTDFVDAPPAGSTPPAGNTGIRYTFHQVLAERADLLSTQTTDETTHFTAGVRHSDLAVSALRAVEKRIALYRDFITLCRQKLALIEVDRDLLEARLKTVNDSLTVARSDAAVAQALLKEEEARLAGINDHREQILRDHVTFVAFHRPRAVEARTEVPVRVIEPALRVSPVPTCLAENLPLPTDLAALQGIFRDSPARWFTHAPKWIRIVNRLDWLRELMVRSVARVGITGIHPVPTPTAGRYSFALTRIFAARQAVSLHSATVVSKLNPALFYTASWVDLFHYAQDNLTLGHLIDAGPADLSRTASAELRDLFKVGSCLHRSFSESAPFLRLLWAERYSEFDGPADFRDLSKLPRWNEVPFTLRRELQADTDWLYSRMDETQPGALELIHDLIRVGLLLACHAPVEQLITGTVAETTIPVNGGLIRLIADPSRLRVGMTVTVEQPSTVPTIKPLLLRAVIEDLANGGASARIADASTGAKLDPRLAMVHFHETTAFSTR